MLTWLFDRYLTQVAELRDMAKKLKSLQAELAESRRQNTELSAAQQQLTEVRQQLTAAQQSAADAASCRSELTQVRGVPGGGGCHRSVHVREGCHRSVRLRGALSPSGSCSVHRRRRSWPSASRPPPYSPPWSPDNRPWSPDNRSWPPDSPLPSPYNPPPLPPPPQQQLLLCQVREDGSRPTRVRYWSSPQCHCPNAPFSCAVLYGSSSVLMRP